MRTSTRNGRKVYIPDNAPDKYFYTESKALNYERKSREKAAIGPKMRTPARTKVRPKTSPGAQGVPARAFAGATIPQITAMWKPPTPRYVHFPGGRKEFIPEGEHPVFTSPEGRVSLVWDVSDAEGYPIPFDADAVFVRKPGTYTFDALVDPTDPEGLFSVELRAGMTTTEFLDAVLRSLDSYPRAAPFPLSLLTDLRQPFRSSFGSIRIVWGRANPAWLHDLGARVNGPKVNGSKLRLDAAAVSDQGPRPYQEDRALVDGNLVVVADGMGGHAGGDRAAQAAVDTIRAQIRKGRSLREAVVAAHRAVVRLSDGQPLGAPGATVVAVLFDLKAGVATVVHSGDARCTIVDPSGAVRRSVDHSFAGNMYRAGRLGDDWIEPQFQSSQIYQALGHDCDPEEIAVRLVRGQTFVLSSDGVHDVLVRDLEALVGSDSKARSPAMARRLVDAALPTTKDNATCAVVKVI